MYWTACACTAQYGQAIADESLGNVLICLHGILHSASRDLQITVNCNSTVLRRSYPLACDSAMLHTLL